MLQASIRYECIQLLNDTISGGVRLFSLGFISTNCVASLMYTLVIVKEWLVLLTINIVQFDMLCYFTLMNVNLKVVHKHGCQILPKAKCNDM